MKIHFLALIILFGATFLSVTSFGEDLFIPVQDDSLPAITDEQIEQLTLAQTEAEQARDMASLDPQPSGSLQSGEFNIRITAPSEYPVLMKQVDSNNLPPAHDEQLIRGECFQQILENSPEDVVIFVESVYERFATCKTLSGNDSQLGICSQSVIDQTNASQMGQAIEKETQACVQEALSR